MITECIGDEDDSRIFKVKYSQRQFILRAENQSEREKWVKAITVMMEHHKKVNKIKNKVVNQAQNSWKWSKVDSDIAKEIRLENQKVILVEQDFSIIQASNKIIATILKTNELYDIQRNILHGFNKVKGIITETNRWYMLLSQYNLQDIEDDNFYDKNREFLDNLNEKINPRKKRQKGQSDDSEDEEDKNKFRFKFNIIYQYDPESLTLKNQYPIQDIISWEVDHKQNPNKMYIKYYLPQKQTEQTVLEQPKQQQFTWVNSYLTELMKWNTAITILYKKLEVNALRQKLRQKKSDKFMVKGLSADGQWKQVKQSRIFLILSRQTIKLSGITIQISNVSQVKKDVWKPKVEEQKGTDEKGKQIQCLLILQKDSQQKLYVQFQSADVQKKVRKRITKLIKLYKQKKQSQSAQKNIKKDQAETINVNTYFFDKKMRQSSIGIKHNFYEVMEQDITMRPKRVKKEEGIWGKFVNMFCGNPDQDLLFD